MMLFLHRVRSHPRNESRHMRVARIRRNIQSKIPKEALLCRLDTICGDDSACDGCRKRVARNELGYELEFRVRAKILIVRLHRECWERWRIELPDTRASGCSISRRRSIPERPMLNHTSKS